LNHRGERELGVPCYDVIVIGLGATGSAAAYHLAKRGLRVLGLERTTPVSDRGAGHGGSRVIQCDCVEEPEYTPLLLRARELWEAAGWASGHPIAHRTGGLMIGKPESRTVAGSERTARERHLDHEMLGVDELRRRYPTMSPADDEVALYDPAAGFVCPETAIAAHLDLAARRGAELHFCEPAISWRVTGGGSVCVLAPDATYAAERLVLCPGPQAPRMLADLGLRWRMEQLVSYRFTPRRGTLGRLGEHQPVYVWESDESRQVDGFPPAAGPTVEVAFSFDGGAATAGPEALVDTACGEEIYELAAFSGRCLPRLRGDFVRAAARVHTTVPDRGLLLGRHPGHEQVTLAAGLAGHGFQAAPGIGEALAELSAGARSTQPSDLFDPARFAPSSLGAVGEGAPVPRPGRAAYHGHVLGWTPPCG
jgi:sarcosine oxidase